MTLKMPEFVLGRYDSNGHEQYLTASGKVTRVVIAARPFYSKEEAEVEVIRLEKVWGVFRLLEDWDESSRVLKHCLRYQAKYLFGLKANSPLWVIADRYEEAGKYEEAEFLRK